jgi:hypothetical protein
MYRTLYNAGRRTVKQIRRFRADVTGAARVAFSVGVVNGVAINDCEAYSDGTTTTGQAFKVSGCSFVRMENNRQFRFRNTLNNLDGSRLYIDSAYDIEVMWHLAFNCGYTSVAPMYLTGMAQVFGATFEGLVVVNDDANPVPSALKIDTGTNGLLVEKCDFSKVTGPASVAATIADTGTGNIIRRMVAMGGAQWGYAVKSAGALSSAIAANTAGATTTQAVPGLKVGDAVKAVPSAYVAGLSIFAECSAAERSPFNRSTSVPA